MPETIKQDAINSQITAEVLTQLDTIAEQHQVTIISAIESGSRSWGFPSPDSDYDVRFVYAHKPEWYIQLNPERDVIEVPINAVLDISGWDIRKAMNLANNGNSVIQEWMISPLIYRQDSPEGKPLAAQLQQLIYSAFSAKSCYHHYYSMAKSIMPELDAPEVKLKKFFYISRATLSALWVARKHSMPTVVFADLLRGLTNDTAVLAAFDQQITDKAAHTESETGAIHPLCKQFIIEAYQEISAADIEQMPARQSVLGNEDFREFLRR